VSAAYGLSHLCTLEAEVELTSFEREEHRELHKRVKLSSRSATGPGPMRSQPPSAAWPRCHRAARPLGTYAVRD
jgi:hypothetical protein